jgi:hypothetical protein
MAYETRKVPDEMIFALVAAHNARQEAAVGSNFHADITQITNRADYRAPTVTNDTVSAANATDLTTSLTLVNAEKAVINRHFADTRAHNTAVSAAVSTAAGTDLTTAVALGNAIKAAYNTHLAAANVHFNNDGTNTVSAANATDQTTLNTLLNEIKTDFNAHLIGATAGAMINLVDP